jgi:hypothetical protein
MRWIIGPIVALTIIAQGASAAPVNPVAPDQVAAIVDNTGYCVVALRTNGEVWMNCGTEWSLGGGYGGMTPLPVPVSEVADYCYWYFWTRAGVLWHFNPNNGVGWHVLPLPPPEWGVVRAQQNSFGNAKQSYR